MKPILIRHFYLPFAILLCLQPVARAQNSTIISNSGKVKFTSQASMETIEASSNKIKGAIDQSKNAFAFAVDIKTFKGFNSDLQREHFDENYIETDKFPTASFAGKFIEQVDFLTNGTYTVRAKGMFSIHGIQKERIIKGTITINDSNVTIDATFNIRLEDHDIKVPKIVYEKIAEEIKVEFNIQFKK